MTVLLYFLNVFCAAGQSALGKRYAVGGGNATVFNIQKAVAGIAVFLLFGAVNGLSFHLPTCLFGIGYGVFLCLSMHTGFKALATGPMALTSIIASFSLIIPFLFGIAVWGETVSVYGGIGVALLLLAILLLNFKKEGGVSVLWSVYALLTLLANGICSLIQKYHQIYYPAAFLTEFMLWALLVVLVGTAGMYAADRHRVKMSLSPEGVAAGVMNGAANYIVLYLAATEKASVLFPIVAGANVIAVWLIGRCAFQERLKPIQLIGLLFGILAVILLKA